MSTIVDISALSLNAREAESVSQIIAERVFEHQSLNDAHRVETGITMKEQILLAGRYGKIGKKLTGCKPPEDNQQLPLSEKFWNPADYGFRMNHCASEVNPLWKVFKRKQRRGDYDDLEGTDEMLFLISRIEDALIENLHRHIWFGDLDMDIVSNGGYLADALVAEVDYWTVIDGLWKQIYAAVTATEVPHFNIAENEEAAVADQLDVPAGFAHGIFKGMFAAADVRLRGARDKVIYVTDTIAEEWKGYLEDQSLAFSLQEVKEGVGELRYRGTPIIVRDDWDRSISEFDDGTVLKEPHRALMTTPDNIPFGTMDSESLTEVRSWFSMDLDTNLVQVKSRFDVKLLEGYMAVAAY